MALFGSQQRSAMHGTHTHTTQGGLCTAVCTAAHVFTIKTVNTAAQHPSQSHRHRGRGGGRLTCSAVRTAGATVISGLWWLEAALGFLKPEDCEEAQRPGARQREGFSGKAVRKWVRGRAGKGP